MVKNIKELLETIIVDQSNWKVQLLQHWPTILGNLNTKVRLEKIENDMLVLGVSDSCWLQELYMLSPLLVQTINKKLDSPRIKSLRFKKIGTKKPEKRNTVAQPLSCKLFNLSDQEIKALETVKDHELRAALTDFLQRCKQES